MEFLGRIGKFIKDQVRSSSEKENQPPSEQAVRDLYQSLLRLVQQPEFFRHNKPLGDWAKELPSDRYTTQNLRTRIKLTGQRESTPGVVLSTDPYQCERSNTHEPTPIPEGTFIEIYWGGMRERARINGILEESGTWDSSRPKEVVTPFNRAVFNKYNSIVEAVYRGSGQRIDFTPESS